MKRLIIFYNFILVAVIITTGMLGAKTLPELVSGSLFYPLVVYFALLSWPRRSKSLPRVVPIAPSQPLEEPAPTLRKLTKDESRHLDDNRRKFLKLVGSAGLLLFFSSIFTRKAEAAFFGSVPGPGTVALKDSDGSVIDPAIKQPTDGYRISELDDGTTYVYGGYINKDGAWFISREEIATGSYRYTKGSSSFSTNWTNRASLTYDYFDNIF